MNPRTAYLRAWREAHPEKVAAYRAASAARAQRRRIARDRARAELARRHPTEFAQLLAAELEALP